MGCCRRFQSVRPREIFGLQITALGFMAQHGQDLGFWVLRRRELPMLLC